MLVLNTNQNGGMVNLSNENLFNGYYPDFKGSILCFLGQSVDGNSRKYVEATGGVNYDSYFSEVVEDKHLSGSASGNAGPIYVGRAPSNSQASLSLNANCISKGELPAGMIVGKNVVFGFCGGGDGSGSNVITQASVQFDIRLVHKDGTYTRIWRETINSSLGSSATQLSDPYFGSIYTKNGRIIKSATTNGLTTLEGDRIAVLHNITLTSSTTAATRKSLFLGYKYSANDGRRYPPVQISYEMP